MAVLNDSRLTNCMQIQFRPMLLAALEPLTKPRINSMDAHQLAKCIVQIGTVI
jgi:hypothetical protein